MKFITRKDNIARKILIILLIALILIFAISPNYKVFAEPVEINQEDLPDEGNGILGSLLKQIIQIIDAVGDIVMGTLNKFMLGADGISSAMLSTSNDNIGNADSWLYAGNEEVDFQYGPNTIDTSEFLPWVSNQYDVPNFLYSPEAIFTNNIAALDVNFLNPNNYEAISEDSEAEKAAKSAAEGDLRQVISDWYISFRNIAIVGLLSVLIYLGIRIVISSTAVDKAKYKENLQNWLVALCLVFFIHFIMSGLLMITDKFNNLFENTANEGIVIQAVNPEGGADIKFKTNLIGYIRFNAQSKSMYDAVAYSLLYLIMVIYTCVFTIMYFKRFLYMAFLTMIAPLVALTYPIDKAGDGKAQAFNVWFKEYIMHLILQPVHLILYVALVSSAMELVKNNIIYGLVAIGFLIPAENLIKEMFGLNKAKTTSGFGSFAAGAATMSGLKQVANALGKGKSGNSNKKGSSSEIDGSGDDNGRIRIQDRDFAQSFNGNESNENQNRNPRLTNGQNEDENQNDNMNQDEQDRERQRLLDDRAVWSDMANDPNESESSRRDAQQEVDNIDRDMQQRYLANDQQDQEEQPQQMPEERPEVPHQNQGPIPKEHWKRDLAIKGLKKVGKVAYKGAKIGTKVFGAAGGAMIGLAAGVATGDMSKAISAMGAGMGAGMAIGKSVGELPERAFKAGVSGVDAIKNQADKFQYEKDKAQFGIGEATRRANIRQNESAKTKFMNNKAEKEKYKEMAGRISEKYGDVSAKDLMELAFDYKKAGITDDTQIERGLTMEAKHRGDNSNIHENMIDVVGMTKDYGRDYVLDDKKRAAMQDTIKSNVRGQNNQDKVWDLYTETLGFKNLDSKYAIQRSNAQTPRTQNPPRTQTAPRTPNRPRTQTAPNVN